MHYNFLALINNILNEQTKYSFFLIKKKYQRVLRSSYGYFHLSKYTLPWRFSERPRGLLNVLCTFKLRPVSTGSMEFLWYSHIIVYASCCSNEIWDIKKVMVLPSFCKVILLIFSIFVLLNVQGQYGFYWLYVIIMSRRSFRVNPHSIVCLNVKERLARTRRHIWSLRDSNKIQTHNHLDRKGTLNHLAKLVKWLSCVVSFYLYGAFDCMLLPCHVRVSR